MIFLKFKFKYIVAGLQMCENEGKCDLVDCIGEYINAYLTGLYEKKNPVTCFDFLMVLKTAFSNQTRCDEKRTLQNITHGIDYFISSIRSG